MAVSKALRFQVLRRDGHACRYCGRTPPEVKLHVDHVVAVALGGADTPDNLATACSECNGGKSAIPADAAVVADVAEDAARWARAVEAAAEVMLADLEAREDAREAFEQRWNAWAVGTGTERVRIPLPLSWPKSVDSILATGLPLEVLHECIDIAMRNGAVQPDNTFRYMCGVAWTKARQLHADAHGELTADTSADPESPWAVIPRGDLEGHLWRFETVTEQFLQRIPSFVHEAAETATERDWHNAGEEDASRLDKLPDVLRHVGNVLSRCSIQLQREERDDTDNPWSVDF
jgi:hypothetical protein